MVRNPSISNPSPSITIQIVNGWAIVIVKQSGSTQKIILAPDACKLLAKKLQSISEDISIL